MKEKIQDFFGKELMIIVSLIPFVLMVERTLHLFGINVNFLIYLSIFSIIGFFIVWSIINLFSNLKKYLNIVGMIFCLIGILLWLQWKEYVIFYLFGLSILFVSILPNTRERYCEENRSRKIGIRVFLYFQSGACMGISISFLIALFFWTNIIIYIIIVIEFMNLFNVLHQHLISSIKRLEPITTLKFKDYGKNLLFVIGCGILPMVLGSVLFILFYGYFIFLPVDFSSGKLIIAMIFAGLSVSFSFILTKRSYIQPT